MHLHPVPRLASNLRQKNLLESQDAMAAKTRQENDHLMGARAIYQPVPRRPEHVIEEKIEHGDKAISASAKKAPRKKAA
jgi:hypothetical protein